jgi:hypothetical protein
MVVGITTKMVQNVDGRSILDFYVEENLGDHESRDFWVEVRIAFSVRSSIVDIDIKQTPLF